MCLCRCICDIPMYIQHTFFLSENIETIQSLIDYSKGNNKDQIILYHYIIHNYLLYKIKQKK